MREFERRGSLQGGSHRSAAGGKKGSRSRLLAELVSAPVEIVYPDLHGRKLDLLITRKVGPIADEPVGRFLFEDSLVVGVGRQHPMARRRNIALADLADESIRDRLAVAAIRDAASEEPGEERR